MTAEQNLKVKLTFGYILLILIFSLSILYILREVKNLNVSKDDILIENTKVIQLGNIMSDLYETENSGRMALLSYNKLDAKNYHQQLDSLIINIESLKNNTIQNDNLKLKLDTIIQIIDLKSLTFDQVLDVQAKYTNFDIYNEAKSQIQAIHKETNQHTVKIDTVVEKSSWFGKLKRRFQDSDELLKQKLILENNKIIEQQKENQEKNQEKISNATENIFTKAKKEEVKLLRNYYKKEEQLIQRNKELSFQLRNILAEVEKIILDNSNSKYELSKGVIDKVSSNIAIVGIITSAIALLFGLIILRDLNKSARNKQKLEELNITMEELAKQKSFFMATISHDMVSPLNSLMGFAALLKNTLRTPKQKEYLDNMQQSTKYIKKMVDDLSLFSNLEYNKIKLKNSNFNFANLINNVASNLKNTAKRKNIEFKISVDEKLNNSYNADSYRIQQILTNVISNAIKFTHKGSVTVHAKSLNDLITIEIIDTGIGMEVVNKDDLFIEFVQVHTTNDNKYGGSGLGLNITKRLIDLLNGSITYQSELGKGTTFLIQLPLKTAKEVDTIPTEDEYEYDNEKKLQNKKILVIDDDPLQLKLLEEILHNKVKLITTIENGKDVKKILQKEQYNLIITDMQMPHYSGLNVIADIRSLPNYQQTPVIALTGKIDYDELEYKKLGFNLYMRKPLNINNLYNVIYKLLRIKNRKMIKEEEVTNINTSEFFDLSELSKLLDNDQVAMKQIIDTFIDNAEKDLDHLKLAATNNDIDAISNIAHKMLPMFKQLRMNLCIEPLIQLERSTGTLTSDEIKLVVKQIDEIIKASFNELKKTTLN